MQAALAGRWRFWRKTETEVEAGTLTGTHWGLDDEHRLDQALLQAGREGDQAALERLLGRYEDDLLRLCRSILLNPGEAEDAVQETFLRFLRTLPNYRGEAKVKTWLFQIAINLCRDWRRQHTRQGRDQTVPLDERLDTASFATVQHQPSPEAATVSRLTIQAALEALSPRQRTLLILREQEQWNCAEIGTMFGWSERKVQYELVKVRQALAHWQRGEENR